MTATEAERRRAAGEPPFPDTTADVHIARALLPEAASGAWSIRHASAANYSCTMVAVQLRALVAQELVERIESAAEWLAGEVTP